MSPADSPDGLTTNVDKITSCFLISSTGIGTSDDCTASIALSQVASSSTLIEYPRMSMSAPCDLYSTLLFSITGYPVNNSREETRLLSTCCGSFTSSNLATAFVFFSEFNGVSAPFSVGKSDVTEGRAFADMVVTEPSCFIAMIYFLL